MIQLSKFFKISIHTTTQVVTLLPGLYRVGFNDFNPHHHAGGDNLFKSFFIRHGYFNPHHHAGGDSICNHGFNLICNFNPHHHAGGDFRSISAVTSGLKISIHTTTQVVTYLACWAAAHQWISIHTTTQVVTSPDGTESLSLR